VLIFASSNSYYFVCVCSASFLSSHSYLTYTAVVLLLLYISVDGTGLKKIEDPSLARALLDKVNKMNTENLIQAVIPAIIFASLSKATSLSIVLLTLVGVSLYVFRDKLPKSV
jgi:hypothetical protein